MSWSILSSASVFGDGNTATVTINSTGADLLVVMGNCVSSATGSLTDLVGGQSNSWTETPGSPHIIVSNTTLWYCKPTHVGASHAFTNSPGVSTFPSILAYAISGSATSSPFDSGEAASITSSVVTTIDCNGGLTPATSGDLVLAFLQLLSGSPGLSINDGNFTIDVNDTNVTGLAAAHSVWTSGVVNPAFSWTNGSQAQMVMLTFKAAAGAAITTGRGRAVL